MHHFSPFEVLHERSDRILRYAQVIAEVFDAHGAQFIDCGQYRKDAIGSKRQGRQCRLAESRASSLRMSASGCGEGVDGSVVEAELRPNEMELDQTAEDLPHSSFIARTGEGGRAFRGEAGNLFGVPG